MLKIRNIDGIKSTFRGKQVEITGGNNGFTHVKLLEKAGRHPIGTELLVEYSQIERIDESGTSSYYDPELAEALDEKLNKPYEATNMPCNNDTCDNDNGYEYTNTGYVVDDKKGIYVEKKCTKCGTVTTDGDGDFFDYFVLDNGTIVDIEELPKN